MFFGFHRSRCLQELAELDRLIDQNSESVLDAHYALAGLDHGREADLLHISARSAFSAEDLYCRP